MVAHATSREAGKMNFVVRAITDIKGLSGIQNSWNAFVNSYGNNPVTLYEFTKMFLELDRSQGWDPLVLIGYDNDDIVGIAPLIMRDVFGIRIVRFAFKPYYTTDFIVKDRFRTKFINGLLDLLFQNLKSKVADLAFPTESPNMSILRKICNAKGIFWGTEPYIGHCAVIVPPTATWDQFENSVRGRFKKRFRGLERKLDRAGSWKISYVQAETDEFDVSDKILAVDKASWKEDWRAQKNVENDPELAIIWKGSKLLAKTTPEFTYSVHFLEIDEKPVAFVISLRYKQTGAMVKTSFDERYRAYSPGLVVWNAAFRALFENKNVKKIDFGTDMPFMRIWRPICQSRTRVLLTKGVFPTRVMSLYRNIRVRKLLTRSWSIAKNSNVLD